VREKIEDEVFGISAASGLGIKNLMGAVYEAILTARASDAEAQADGVPVLHPKPKAPTAGVDVLKEGAAYRIVGTKIERLAAMTEFASEDGRAYFDRVLLRCGARRKLEKLGAQPGDRIRVGAVEYTFTRLDEHEKANRHSRWHLRSRARRSSRNRARCACSRSARSCALLAGRRTRTPGDACAGRRSR
jgi:Obg family GTPase CgtA-like protein